MIMAADYGGSGSGSPTGGDWEMVSSAPFQSGGIGIATGNGNGNGNRDRNRIEGFQGLNCPRPDDDDAAAADDHFVFPPSRHEGLPLESQNGDDNQHGYEHEHQQTSVSAANWASVEEPGAEELLGSGDRGLFEEEEEEAEEIQQQSMDSGEQLLESNPYEDEDEEDGEGFLGWNCCREWCRQQLAQTSVLWSFTVCTALIGLVFLGHRWQRERSKNRRLRLQLSAKDQRINELLYQIAILREVASARRKVPVVRALFS